MWYSWWSWTIWLLKLTIWSFCKIILQCHRACMYVFVKEKKCKLYPISCQFSYPHSYLFMLCVLFYFVFLNFYHSASLWQHPYVNVFKHLNIGEWRKATKEGEVVSVMVRWYPISHNCGETQGLKWSKATKVMASDAPLAGLNIPLQNHYLALNIFGSLSRYPMCAVMKEMPDIKVMKFKFLFFLIFNIFVWL